MGTGGGRSQAREEAGQAGVNMLRRRAAAEDSFDQAARAHCQSYRHSSPVRCQARAKVSAPERPHRR